MTRNPRPLVALALAALISLISAGCGSDTPSGTGPDGSSGGRTATDRDKAVKFSACMRENGVGDFPDPDAAGEFDYGITVSDVVWGKAIDACKDLQPPGSFSAERNTEQQAAALKFAECIREHGVKDFPDPVDGEPLVDTNRIPSSNREGGMTILNAAMRACSEFGDVATGSKP
jgi:hypothetical protein